MELLQRWRDVYQEARQFSEEVARLPDDCHCQDADAHLEERCPCCADHRQASELGDPARNCTDILTCLRADVSMLCDDFEQVARPLVKGNETELRLDLRRGVFLSANDLQRIVSALDGVSEAVVGFRRTCAVSGMRGVKRYTAALREHCDQLNARLQHAQPECG